MPAYISEQFYLYMCFCVHGQNGILFPLSVQKQNKNGDASACLVIIFSLPIYISEKFYLYRVFVYKDKMASDSPSVQNKKKVACLLSSPTPIVRREPAAEQNFSRRIKEMAKRMDK